jgi:hypothetical protein
MHADQTPVMPTTRPDAAAEPFFVVGAVRSGTTVLRLLLGHHPAICRCEEFEFVAPYVPSVGSPWPDVESYADAIEHFRGFKASGLRVDRSLDSVATIAKDFLRQQAALDARPIVGAVVHHDFDRLPRIWPQARYIHMLRDPRDVSRSCVQMGWAGNAWGATPVWSAAFGAWRRLRSQVPAEHLLEVRYEALVADTEAELNRICRFLGTEYDPAMLEIERDTTYRRPSPTEASSWRERAPAEEIRQMEARLGAELAEAGYSPSGLPPLSIDPVLHSRLWLEHRWRRLRFAQRRFGLPLWLFDAIVRRLPLHRAQRWTQSRIDRIVASYNK